jgi:hypothetical protein
MSFMSRQGGASIVPEREVETLLRKQLALSLKRDYRKPVHVSDIMFGKNSIAERFPDSASFAMGKFAESDRDKWRTGLAAITRAINDLLSGSASASQSTRDILERPARQSENPTAQQARESMASRKARKPARRSRKYEEIDRALVDVSKACPNNHEEVFRFLDERSVAIPNREPFKAAGGWLKGFQRNRHTARSWLSQAWGLLGLPAFARGPKK